MTAFKLERDRNGTLALYDDELLGVWYNVVEGSDLHKSLERLVELANLGANTKRLTGRLAERDPGEQSFPQELPTIKEGATLATQPVDRTRGLRPEGAASMPPPPGARKGHEPGCESWVGYHCTCQ